MNSYVINARRAIATIVTLAVFFIFVQFAFAVTSSPLPSSDGAYTQWTPKSGTSHFTMVDESSCNGLTDYNSTDIVGNRDSYGIAGIPDGSTITSISITPCASNNKAGGASTLNVFYRFNGVNSADAGGYSLSGTTPTGLTATTFSGLSLVKTSLTSLEIGAVLSAGSKGARVSKLATTITYTLEAPTNLTGNPISSSQIDLSWTDNSSNESGFYIERSSNPTGPFTQISTTTASVTNFSDTGLSSGTTYYHRVRAYVPAGASAYSNVATTTTP
jgi:hypothetical protein